MMGHSGRNHGGTDREDTIRLARQCDVPHNGFAEEAITFLRECLSFSFHETKSVIIFSEENSHG
jgi:hypothetical protein